MKNSRSLFPHSKWQKQSEHWRKDPGRCLSFLTSGATAQQAGAAASSKRSTRRLQARYAHISDEAWRLRLAGRVHFASLLPQVQYLCECVCTHVHWLLSVCILYKPGRIFRKCVQCGRWNEKALFFGGHISPLPSAQDSVCICFLSCVFLFFHAFTVILVCLCYSKVLSAFYDIKCLCQRWQDWTDGLCSTENWFCGGLTFHQLHFTLLIHHWLPSHLSRPYWSDQDR